jgi:hypothetical protein
MINSITKVITLFLIGILFSQCAIFGSRKTIVAKASKPLKKIALIIVVENDPFSQNVANSSNVVFIKSLAENFASQKQFDFMIIDKEYVILEKDDLEKSFIGVEMRDYDAYILCYRKMQSGFNHKVWFEVFETNPGKQLINTSHSTRMGNSYFMPPDPYETLIDATKGSFDVLMTHWNKVSN